MGPRVIGEGYLPFLDEKKLYLYVCDGPESIIGEGEIKDKHVSDLIDLAYYISDTSKTLDRAGYRRSVWQPTLDQYEERQLKTILSGKRSTVDLDFDRDSHFLKDFARMLNGYRAKTGKTSLREAYTGTPGCGAGEAPVYIKFQPRPTRIQYMRLIYFNLCLRSLVVIIGKIITFLLRVACLVTIRSSLPCLVIYRSKV